MEETVDELPCEGNSGGGQQKDDAEYDSAKHGARLYHRGCVTKIMESLPPPLRLCYNPISLPTS
jgi:hypothetical protein